MWPLGGTPPGMLPGTVKRVNKPKAPLDQIPITVDFRSALDIIECDTLLGTAVPAVSSVRNDDTVSDLVFIPPPVFSTDLTRVTLWFAGGTAVFEYLITIVARSAGNQVLERSFILPVYNR